MAETKTTRVELVDAEALRDALRRLAAYLPAESMTEMGERQMALEDIARALPERPIPTGPELVDAGALKRVLVWLARVAPAGTFTEISAADIGFEDIARAFSDGPASPSGAEPGECGAVTLPERGGALGEPVRWRTDPEEAPGGTDRRRVVAKMRDATWRIFYVDPRERIGQSLDSIRWAPLSELIAAAERPAAEGWQPMETAPRDGSEFLAHSDAGLIWLVHYRDELKGFYNVEHRVSCLTHWQPLPAPPVTGEGGQ